MPSSRARKRASGTSSCESGKRKTRLPASRSRAPATARCARSRPGSVTRRKRAASTPQASAAARSQSVVPSAPSGNGAASRSAPRSSSARAVSARNGCASRNEVPGPTGGSSAARRGGRKRTGAMPSSAKSRRSCPSTTSASAPATRSDALAGRCRRQRRHEGGEAGVLALREGRLDAAARVVEDADAGLEHPRQAGGRARQVELDDLRRAGAHQEQQPDVGAPLEQAGRDPVQLLVGVGQPGEVALLDDRGGEARLGEDHDARRRLEQVGAGARAHDQEEGVLDLAVQPDDAGEPAEHLALAALAQHREVRAALGRGGERAHPASPSAASAGAASWLRRAARSLRRNCVAFTA